MTSKYYIYAYILLNFILSQYADYCLGHDYYTFNEICINDMAIDNQFNMYLAGRKENKTG